MSERVAVFLRGLNVGGHRVKMAHLRDVLEAAGFAEVETLLASGNVVLDPNGEPASRIESRIEAALEEDLGYAVPSFVRSLAELSAALEGPFAPGAEDGPDYARYVVFLKVEVDAAVRAIFEALPAERDSFGFGEREVHLLSRGRLSESPLFDGPFERATRTLPNTMRKVTTLGRVVAKLR